MHDVRLVDLAAGLDDQFAGGRVLDVNEGGTAENALADGRNHLTGIDDGGHGQALVGAAICRVDDAILRNVDQTTGEVTRVRRLQERYLPGPYGRRATS